jgi:beta-mannanase
MESRQVNTMSYRYKDAYVEEIGLAVYQDDLNEAEDEGEVECYFELLGLSITLVLLVGLDLWIVLLVFYVVCVLFFV